MKKSLVAFCLMLCFFAGAVKAVQEIQEATVQFLKPKLNSDRIEYFFGNYGVDPLDVDSPVFPGSRISNLYSIHQGKKLMRTLAVVDFYQPVLTDLQMVHRQIAEGKSIGIALREDGWTIHKNPVYFGLTCLSPALLDWMGKPSSHQAAVHIYRLEVSRKDQLNPIPYCTIIEVHSPDYLSQEWLQVLYDDQFQAFSLKTKEVENLINRLSTLIQNFPLPE